MSTASHARRSLGVVLTHPIQYFTPLLRRLDREVDLTVYYAHRPTPEEQGLGFGVPFEWDIDLTSGYRHVWLRNRSVRPDLVSLRGCDTPEIGALLRAAAHDAVLVAGWHALTYWQAMLGAWRGGIPVLVRGDSQLVGERGPARTLVKELVYPLFIRRFAACLSVGTRSEAYFRHYGARRVFRVPHYVDNAFFAERSAAETRAAARARFGIPERAFVVLFAGKLAEKKRPGDVVEAIARLGQEGPHLLIAGDGELRAELMASAQRHGIRATFAGFMNQTEIPRAYAASDVLVLPSDGRETWGLVVNEAMACGLPAIVADAVGCSPDLIVPGETGYVIPLGDVDALARRLGELAAAPERAAAMGRAARSHIAAFDVEAAAQGAVAAVEFVARGSR